MRFAVACLLIGSVVGVPVRVVAREFALGARVAPPGLLPLADVSGIARPTPLLVQDVDAEGHVRILREVYLDERGRYINDGRYREVDTQSRLVQEGGYRDGLRDGHWVQIHRDPLPPLFRTPPYSAFSAPFYSEAEFQNGRLQGTWRIFDSQRRVVSEIRFVHGLRHGEARWWHANGNLRREMAYKGGAPHGAVRTFDELGVLIQREDFDTGRRLFAETEFYDGKDLLQSVGLFLDRRLRAVSPDSWETCEFARFERVGTPAKHGLFTRWHANGQKAMQGEFVNDQPRGEFQWWYPTGELRTVGSFRDGQPDGAWQWRLSNGQLQMAGEYVNGQPTGEWRFYDQQGRVISHATAENGAPRLLAAPDATELLRAADQ